LAYLLDITIDHEDGVSNEYLDEGEHAFSNTNDKHNMHNEYANFLIEYFLMSTVEYINISNNNQQQAHAAQAPHSIKHNQFDNGVFEAYSFLCFANYIKLIKFFFLRSLSNV
jgi:hypothetical protein